MDFRDHNTTPAEIKFFLNQEKFKLTPALYNGQEVQIICPSQDIWRGSHHEAIAILIEDTYIYHVFPAELKELNGTVSRKD